MRGVRMVKKVMLNYDKAQRNNMFVDYKQYMNKYNCANILNSYKILGAPLIINIQGHYIKVSDLQDLTYTNIDDYMMSLRTAQPCKCLYIFKWYRNKC